MHIESRHFTLYAKRVLPNFFKDKRVLDVGSGDINGNNRFLFTNCDYTGNDVVMAKNVTIVSKTKDLPYEENTFDTIISTECFEHDPEYKQSLIKIHKMLKPGGLFVITCAAPGRPEHGTRRTTPHDSFGTLGNLADMNDYYKNLDENDLNDAIDLETHFEYWSTYINTKSKDLYFIGLKHGSQHTIDEEYKASHVVNTSVLKFDNLHIRE